MNDSNIIVISVFAVLGLIIVPILIFFSYLYGQNRLKKFHKKCEMLGFRPLSGILHQYCAGNWQELKTFVAFYPNRNLEMNRGIAIFIEIGMTISQSNLLPANAKLIQFNNLLQGSFLASTLKEGFSNEWKGSALMLLLPLKADVSQIQNGLETAYSLRNKLLKN